MSTDTQAVLSGDVRAPTVELFINGEFTPPTGDAYFESVEPATERTLASVAVASSADVDAAVVAARRAFDSGPWPRMRADERAAMLQTVADLLEESLPELAELETRDTGLPILYTEGGHLPRAVAHFRYFAEEARRLLGETYPMDDAYLSFVTREPVGVAALLTPWNAPLSVASMNVAAALASGNTCVLKPSELAPLTAARLAGIVQEAELPPGVLNIVQGTAHPTGHALVSHPGVDVISFTGGTETGREIMRQAAGGLKRLSCELGGKSANVIFADADFEQALDSALLCVFANNGASCVAGSRILLERPLHREFLDAFVKRAGNIRVGDPLSFETEMGPMISKGHMEKVAGYVRAGVDEGATLCCGGGRPPHLSSGYYQLPTVFSDVSNRMRVAREEIFGPVVAFIAFDDEEECVRVANDSPYGLAGYVWSGNAERAMRVARQIRAGTVSINAPTIRDFRAPFGGYKQSGFGRTGGRHSIEAFTELKTTCLPINPYKLPRMGL